MRSILILTNRIPYPLRDGGALAMDAMIRGYQLAGWQVHVLAMNTSRHAVQPETVTQLYPQIAGFHTVAVDNAVTITGILKNLLLSREPEHVDRFRSPGFASALIGLLRQVQPDAVQLESPFLGTYLPEIRKYAPKTRIVYRMHNVEGQIWGRLAGESGGIRRVYLRSLTARMARYERRLWTEVDLLLPITATDAAVVRKAEVATPLEVAPFGIVAHEAAPPAPALTRMYHIGAMDWIPNQEGVRWFLQQIWPGLHDMAPGLSFHFAGRNMPEAFREGLPEGAFCVGVVPDAAAFAGDKHILVVPLRSGGGIRVKVLEAMARGKLVISTALGMQGIEAKAGLHYLCADTGAEFMEHAAWAATHPEGAAAIAGAAQQLIRDHYDEKQIMHRVIQRLEGLLPS
jgi:glycosyltransferase involved in cell wall biosynthesis